MMLKKHRRFQPDRSVSMNIQGGGGTLLGDRVKCAVKADPVIYKCSLFMNCSLNSGALDDPSSGPYRQGSSSCGYTVFSS